MALTSLPVVDQEALRVAAAGSTVGVAWMAQRLEGWSRRRPADRVVARTAWWPTAPRSMRDGLWGGRSALPYRFGGQVLGLRAALDTVEPVGRQSRAIFEDDVREDCVVGDGARDRTPCPQFLYDLAVASSGARVVLARVTQNRGHPTDRPYGPFCVSTLRFPVAAAVPGVDTIGCVAAGEGPRRWPHHVSLTFNEHGGRVVWRAGDDGFVVDLDATGMLSGALRRVPARGSVTDLAVAAGERHVDLAWCERDAVTGERRRVSLRDDGPPARSGSCALLAIAAGATTSWTAWVEPDDAGGDVLRADGAPEPAGAAEAAPVEVLRGPTIRAVAMAAVVDGAVLAWLERGSGAVRWVRLHR